MLSTRQWPQVNDLCHTFSHVARVKKYTNMQEMHAKHTDMHETHTAKHVCFSHVTQTFEKHKRTRNACFSRMSVFFFLIQLAKTCNKI